MLEEEAAEDNNPSYVNSDIIPGPSCVCIFHFRIHSIHNGKNNGQYRREEGGRDVHHNTNYNNTLNTFYCRILSSSTGSKVQWKLCDCFLILPKSLKWSKSRRLTLVLSITTFKSNKWNVYIILNNTIVKTDRKGLAYLAHFYWPGAAAWISCSQTHQNPSHHLTCCRVGPVVSQYWQLLGLIMKRPLYSY